MYPYRQPRGKLEGVRLRNRGTAVYTAPARRPGAQTTCPPGCGQVVVNILRGIVGRRYGKEEQMKSEQYSPEARHDGEEAMRAEFERLLPTMKTGGFVPSCDHQTPPGVSFENYQIYVRLLGEYARKAVE